MSKLPNKEIKLSMPVYDSVRGGEFKFCSIGFRKVVDIPADVRECVLVATQEPFDDDADIRIKRPYRNHCWNMNMSNITPIGDRDLYPETKRAFARLHRQGYRYFHFEYED